MSGSESALMPPTEQLYELLGKQHRKGLNRTLRKCKHRTNIIRWQVNAARLLLYRELKKAGHLLGFELMPNTGVPHVTKIDGYRVEVTYREGYVKGASVWSPHTKNDTFTLKLDFGYQFDGRRALRTRETETGFNIVGLVKKVAGVIEELRTRARAARVRKVAYEKATNAANRVFAYARDLLGSDVPRGRNYVEFPGLGCFFMKPASIAEDDSDTRVEVHLTWRISEEQAKAVVDALATCVVDTKDA